MPVVRPDLTARCVHRAANSVSLLVASVSMLGGCAVPLPATVSQAEWADRVVFTCYTARTLELARAQSGQLAVVVFDGRTLQLPRASDPSAERYSNGPQTLTIFGDSATFESVGETTPCTKGRSRDRD